MRSINKRKQLNEESVETRQERRERKLKKQREQMRQHGKSLGKIYRNVVLKRAKNERKK